MRSGVRLAHALRAELPWVRVRRAGSGPQWGESIPLAGPGYEHIHALMIICKASEGPAPAFPVQRIVVALSRKPSRPASCHRGRRGAGHTVMHHSFRSMTINLQVCTKRKHQRMMLKCRSSCRLPPAPSSWTWHRATVHRATVHRAQRTGRTGARAAVAAALPGAEMDNELPARWMGWKISQANEQLVIMAARGVGIAYMKGRYRGTVPGIQPGGVKLGWRA